jgi:hypothetical protein
VPGYCHRITIVWASVVWATIVSGKKRGFARDVQGMETGK